MLSEHFQTLIDSLTVKTTTPGPLFGAKVHLYTAGPILGPRNLIADFTEAAYTGYTSQTVTWGTPYFDVDGNGKIEGGVQSFILSADLTGPVTILGYFVTDTAGTGLKYAELFTAPQVIQFAGDAIVFILQYEEAPSPGTAALLS
jgi:hypothetical protein